jgi:hypothetical protein
MICILVWVMVAIMGCRLQLELMVLKVNFLSSSPVGESGVLVDMLMLDVLRAWAVFNTHLAFSVRPCSSVLLNS